VRSGWNDDSGLKVNATPLNKSDEDIVSVAPDNRRPAIQLMNIESSRFLDLSEGTSRKSELIPVVFEEAIRKCEDWNYRVAFVIIEHKDRQFNGIKNLSKTDSQERRLRDLGCR